MCLHHSHGATAHFGKMRARQEGASAPLWSQQSGRLQAPSAFQASWQFNMLSVLTALCGLFNRSLSFLTALRGSGNKGKGVKT